MNLDLSKVKGKEKGKEKGNKATISYDELFVAGELNMESAVTAPDWKDGSGKRSGEVEVRSYILRVVRSCSQNCAKQHQMVLKQ